MEGYWAVDLALSRKQTRRKMEFGVGGGVGWCSAVSSWCGYFGQILSYVFGYCGLHGRHAGCGMWAGIGPLMSLKVLVLWLRNSGRMCQA